MNQTNLHSSLITTSAGFKALKDEWEELYSECPAATPFQSWAWLYSWWENYGERYELRLSTLRDESGLLIGLLPFMVQRKMRTGRLLFIGTRTTDYLDILARSGYETLVAETSKGILLKDSGWTIADFQQLPPYATAWELFRIWDLPAMFFEQSVSPCLEVDDWEAMTGRLGKNRRKTARRAVKRLHEHGADFKIARADHIEEAARRLVRLHRELWKNRAITKDNLTDRFENHIVAAARRMGEHGSGYISELWSEGEVVASHFLTVGRESVGELMSGASDEALERYQLSSLYVWDDANMARHLGLKRFDFLRGGEEYKLRWFPELTLTYRIVLSRGAMPVLLFRAYRSFSLTLRRYSQNRESRRVTGK